MVPQEAIIVDMVPVIQAENDATQFAAKAMPEGIVRGHVDMN